jgi:hypothetical protein
MEPNFRWWRYGFGFFVPPWFVYILGHPDKEECNACGFLRDSVGPHRLVTRLSMTTRLPTGFWLALVLYWGIAAAIVVPYMLSR